jgi:4-amino-4-deoxy-L-arabinose transferase-like glycosyltransferase
MAAVTALVMPVFWVSSTTVMSDTMMLAWWVWATVSWVRGMEKREPFSLALAAFLIAVAAMTKYFAVSLIPLLLVYSIVRERRLGWWAAYLLIPVAVLMGCEWAARSLYGHGMLFDAGSYALEASHRVGWTSRGLTTLVFTGGCVVAALFYAPLLWSRKGLFYGILVTVLVAGVFLEMETLGNFPLHHDEGGRWLALMQLSVLAAGGISLLALAAADHWQRRDAGSVLLVLWIVGTFVFTWILNWTVNGRSILPMVPAAGILLVRRIERRLGSSVGKRLRLQWWPLVPTGLLALAVVWADVQLAGTARAAAGEIHDRYKGERGTVWFQGHWGFQYYMESRGGKAIDVKGSRLAPGDLVVIPNNNTNLFPIRPEWFLRIARSEQPGCRWLATMNPVVGAGFYADVWGPLPFAVGSVPPEYYDVLRFR